VRQRFFSAPAFRSKPDCKTTENKNGHFTTGTQRVCVVVKRRACLGKKTEFYVYETHVCKARSRFRAGVPLKIRLQKNKEKSTDKRNTHGVCVAAAIGSRRRLPPPPPPPKHLDIFKGAPLRLPTPLSDQFPVRVCSCPLCIYTVCELVETATLFYIVRWENAFASASAFRSNPDCKKQKEKEKDKLNTHKKYVCCEQKGLFTLEKCSNKKKLWVRQRLFSAPALRSRPDCAKRKKRARINVTHTEYVSLHVCLVSPLYLNRL